MNWQLSGKNMKEIFAPKETILLFECDANGNPIVRHHFCNSGICAMWHSLTDMLKD